MAHPSRAHRRRSAGPLPFYPAPPSASPRRRPPLLPGSRTGPYFAFPNSRPLPELALTSAELAAKNRARVSSPPNATARARRTCSRRLCEKAAAAARSPHPGAALPFSPAPHPEAEEGGAPYSAWHRVSPLRVDPSLWRWWNCGREGGRRRPAPGPRRRSWTPPSGDGGGRGGRCHLAPGPRPRAWTPPSVACWVGPRSLWTVWILRSLHDSDPTVPDAWAEIMKRLLCNCFSAAFYSSSPSPILSAYHETSNFNLRMRRYTTILELGGSDITSFFGVFDGRGGDEVGVHCFKQFHTQLIKDPAYENDPRTAMENAYLRIGGQLEEINESRKSYSSGNSNTKYKWPQKEGSTSCAVLIRGNHIIVGNVGDSHCLLSRNGQGIDISFNDNLSRTSGDLKSKQNEGLSPSEQQMTCNRNIYTENITHDVDFLLLIASKGIWHDTKNQHVVDFVHKLLKSGDVDPCGICERIIDSYTEPGDNSTVILVQFKDGALVSSKTSEFDGTNILEEIWYEILVRVSSKMIIRCRSVCKQWLNITTTPKFIEHHHGEQKLQLIVPVHYSGNMYSCLHRVLAINLSCMEDGFQTIIRSTTFGKYKPRDGEDEAKHIVSVVHASVDGLLLLSFDKTCYVVNPATRKSSHLAPVDNAQKVLGLYRHTLTGEYRVLYLRAVDEDLEEEGPEDDEPFCILSIALQNTRSILLTPYVYARLVFAMDGQPPAVIGDHLYWAPSAFEKQITVFDSKSEVFRWMESPAKNSKNSTIKLIELKGKPAVSSSTKGASKVELFMLEMEGCQSESWVRSHTVELPAEELNHSWAGRFESFFVSLDGDILIECVWRDGDREKKSPGQLLYRDQNGELDVLLEAYLGTSPVHVLKESLASHSFLNDHHPGSPLFEGL